MCETVLCRVHALCCVGCHEIIICLCFCVCVGGCVCVCTCVIGRAVVTSSQHPAPLNAAQVTHGPHVCEYTHNLTLPHKYSCSHFPEHKEDRTESHQILLENEKKKSAVNYVQPHQVEDRDLPIKAIHWQSINTSSIRLST